MTPPSHVGAGAVTVGRQHRARCRPILEWHHWDRIAERMAGIIAMAERDAVAASAGLERTA